MLLSICTYVFRCPDIVGKSVDCALFSELPIPEPPSLGERVEDASYGRVCYGLNIEPPLKTPPN